MERMVDEFLAFVRGDAMEGTEATDAVALVQGVDCEGRGTACRLAGVEGEAEPVEMRPQAVARAVENLIAQRRALWQDGSRCDWSSWTASCGSR